VASSDLPREIADQAVALALATGTGTGTGTGGDHAGDRAALLKLAGDEAGPLEEARELLVRRIRTRSDDYPATSGLSLLNATLSMLGKEDPVEWQPRKWRIPH
jgi:hypothetical protein